MSLDLEFNRLKVSNNLKVTSNNKIECRVPLTETESANLLEINVVTNLYSQECIEKEIRYSGRGVFTILYKSEGEIKKYETGVDYSFKFPCENAKENTPILGKVVVDNPTLTTLNGITMASAILTFNADLTLSNEIAYLEKDKNLLVKSKETECCLDLCNFLKESKIEEEFETSELISNVLLHSEKAYVTDCQAGVGNVTIDGEIELNILAQEINKTLPTTITKKIPFRSEVELSDAIPNSYATCFVEIKGANLKIFVDENKNKSSISCEIILFVCGKVYQKVSIYPCEDAYSTQKEISLEYSNACLGNVNSFKCLDFLVEREISVNDDKNTRLICLLSDKIEEITIDNFELTGAVSFVFLCQNDEFATYKTLVPISFTLPLIGNNCSFLSATITDATLNDSKNLLSFKVKVSYLDKEDLTLKVVSGVIEGEDKVVNNSAISVYIPNAGDTLWEISKELGVSSDVILKTNSDLTFPLNGEERIVIYREIESNK